MQRLPTLLVHVAIVATVLGTNASVAGTPTRIDVRVKSKGAKFVGTSMGGAQVVLRDADTGDLLARGVTRGTTGDTARLMTEARTPGKPLSTPEAAVFHAELQLDEPLRLRVEAFGPLAQRQAANSTSVTQWVVPGKHVTGGDGLLLELPGFAVDVLAPPAHRKLAAGTETIELTANVVMMCGCPVTAGGLWDANAFEISAIVHRDGERLRTQPLEYAGEASRFSTRLEVDEPGAYEVTVYAYDPANGNTGLDRTTFVVAD